jgi:hypothetical protein
MPKAASVIVIVVIGRVYQEDIHRAVQRDLGHVTFAGIGFVIQVVHGLNSPATMTRDPSRFYPGTVQPIFRLFLYVW